MEQRKEETGQSSLEYAEFETAVRDQEELGRGSPEGARRCSMKRKVSETEKSKNYRCVGCLKQRPLSLRPQVSIIFLKECQQLLIKINFSSIRMI